jgi:hypothetical protein
MLEEIKADKVWKLMSGEKAMETVSETQKRNAGEGEESGNKKRRRSGDEASCIFTGEGRGWKWSH